MGSNSTEAEPIAFVGPIQGSPSWYVEILAPWTKPPTVDDGEVHLLDEVEGPHETIETAQLLPTASAIRLQGSLDPWDRIDLYRMSLPSGFRSIRIDLSVANPSPESLERLVLFDQNGQVIETRAVDLESGQLVLILRKSVPVSGDSLMIGIYRPELWEGFDGLPAGSESGFPLISIDGDFEAPSSPKSDSASQPMLPVSPYELNLTTEWEPNSDRPKDSSPSGKEKSGSESPLSSGDRPLTLPPASASFGEEGVRHSSRDEPFQDVLGRDEQAARPSPLRSSSPRAGLFSIGPATRPIDRRTAAVVDMTLVDLPDSLEVSDSTNAADPLDTLGDGDGDPDAIPALHAPAALPLDSLPAHSRRSTTDFAPLVWELRRQRPASSRTQPAASSRTAGASSPPGHDETAQPLPLGPQVALRAGLTLAYGLAFTFLLPDLTTRFQTLRDRPRPRIRKRWLRRFFGGSPAW